MTTEERKALREALSANGFKRIGYTPDLSGKGDYTETWANGMNVVSVAWSVRGAVFDVETTGMPSEAALAEAYHGIAEQDMR